MDLRPLSGEFNLQQNWTKAMTKVVGIIGTGDYGRALANRLLRCGYDVIMASRNPDLSKLINIDERLASVKVKETKELFEDPAVEIIFLAIHSWNFESCLAPFKNQTQQKIFVDISNRERPSKTESNPERLVEAFPDLRVVKAFNTLSAYALESDTFGGAKQVLIASDDSAAREKISTLARDMGFTPIDYGALRAARDLEAYPLTLMVGWGWPTLYVFSVFLLWTVICASKRHYDQIKYSSSFNWDDIPIGFINEPVALTAGTLLTITYMPGCFAAFLQLFNGTKYKRFPNWLDNWLKLRKMFGLYALFFSVFHVMIAGIAMSPSFMKWWYTGTYIQLPVNASGYQFTVVPKMNLIGELTILVGIISILLMGIIGLASLPSVGSGLNWREWRFVQSHMGYLVLFLVTVHVCLPLFKQWVKSPRAIKSSVPFYFVLMPMLVILMKFLLLLPCISHYVDKIRSGWDRKPNYQRLHSVNQI